MHFLLSKLYQDKIKYWVLKYILVAASTIQTRLRHGYEQMSDVADWRLQTSLNIRCKVVGGCCCLLAASERWCKLGQGWAKYSEMFQESSYFSHEVSITPRNIGTNLLHLEINILQFFDAEEIGFFPRMTRTHVAANQFHIQGWIQDSVCILNCKLQCSDWMSAATRQWHWSKRTRHCEY